MAVCSVHGQANSEVAYAHTHWIGFFGPRSVSRHPQGRQQTPEQRAEAELQGYTQNWRCRGRSTPSTRLDRRAHLDRSARRDRGGEDDGLIPTGASSRMVPTSHRQAPCHPAGQCESPRAGWARRSARRSSRFVPKVTWSRHRVRPIPGHSPQERPFARAARRHCQRLKGMALLRSSLIEIAAAINRVSRRPRNPQRTLGGKGASRASSPSLRQQRADRLHEQRARHHEPNEDGYHDYY